MPFSQPGNSTDSHLAEQYLKKYGIILKTRQIEGIRRACQLAAQILDQDLQNGKSGSHDQ